MENEKEGVSTSLLLTLSVLAAVLCSHLYNVHALQCFHSVLWVTGKAFILQCPAAAIH